MKRRLFLAALLLLSASAPLAAEVAEKGVTLTVKAGDKPLNSNDFQFTQKPAYVYLILNISPYLPSLPGGKAGIPALLGELLKTEGQARYPKAKAFKIDVAEVAERDDYGLPAWDKVKLLERYSAKKNGKKAFSLKKLAQ